MTVKYHMDLIQGSPEWFAMRCGTLSASEMKLILTPKLKVADNDKTKAHLWELLGQRINKYVEPTYISDDMLKGGEVEIIARAEYEKHYYPIQTCGGISNDKFGFNIWYSPDGLVGSKGLWESKSRRQGFQFETICENVATNTQPEEFVLQSQTGLMVADDREWQDFTSYNGGTAMATIRVFPDPVIQEAIFRAAYLFEKKLKEKMAKYYEVMETRKSQLIPTERKIETEILV
jgi:hypothetical protein